VDNIAREVQKEVLLSNFMFSGLRADLTKVEAAWEDQSTIVAL
jgi:hypothetical protein